VPVTRPANRFIRQFVFTKGKIFGIKFNLKVQALLVQGEAAVLGG
jgi:hypothetical protein